LHDRRPTADARRPALAALKSSGLSWTKATLDRLLTAPSKLVPGTRMVVAMPDPKPRADVVAYLARLKN